MADRTRETLQSLGLTEEEIEQELLSQKEDQEGLETDDGGTDATLVEETEEERAEREKAEADEATRLAAEEAAKTAPASPAAAAPAPASAAAPAIQPAAGPTAAEVRAERIKVLDTQIEAIDVKFDNAELTATERRTAAKALEDERKQLERLEIEEATILRINQERHQTEWKGTVQAFLDANTQYAPGTVGFDSLNAAVIREQQAADKRGEPTQTKAVLDAAHAALQKAFGVQAKPAADVIPPTPAVPKVGKRPPAPPTLAVIPKSGNEDLAAGEFAHLDKLGSADDPEALERAMKKMTPEQRDRYLASA